MFLMQLQSRGRWGQCSFSHFWVSKWHPNILQWHPKFWKSRYGFPLY